MATSTLGNVTDSWTYDTYGYLTGYTAKYSGTTIYSYTLTRDTGSRISGKSETIGGVTTVYVYTYDSAGRLKTVTKGGAAYSSYNYDSNSNRTSGVTAGTAFTATYDDQDRILTYNTNTYGYNANGELTSKQVGSATPTSYEYNQLGNLKQVTLPTSSVIKYSLDGYQRRAIRQVGTSPREFYTHEGPLKVVGSLTEGSSTSLKTFIFGADGNSPEYIRYQGANLRVIKDHLGSVRLVVNASTGTIVQRIDYNDIGGVVSDTNPGFQPYGFAGGMYDYQTGLVKFGAREYDSQTGRWTSKDPIRFGGGDTNLFGYVANDPINHIDPSGKICFAVRGITKIGELFLLAAEKNRLVNEYNSISENSCPSSAQQSRKNAISERVNQIDNIFNNRSTLHGFIGDVLDSCNNTGIYGPSNPQVDGI